MIKKSIIYTFISFIILNIVVFILTQDSNYTLGCGLFVFIGTNPGQNFYWDKFNILGWFNDVRGGDACGRVYNTDVQYGIDKLRNYKDFAMEVKNPTDDIWSNVVLGHCRKASSGGKDSIYAQPIVLRKKDINLKIVKNTQFKKLLKTLDDETIIYSGIHNGTIENYKELAPKYGIPMEDHNDTKVLLTALFYGYTEILQQYVGTAALVWQNHLTNKAYIYKGKSKYYSASTTTTEERPLYYWAISDDNFYLSSIDDSFKLIGAKDEDIINLDCNVLYTFKGGKKVEELKISREECFQNLPKNTTKWNSFEDREREREFNHYFGYSNIYKRHYYPDTVRIPERNSNVRKTVTTYLWNKEKVIRRFDDTEDGIRLQAEINSALLGKNTKRVIFNKGRYWMHGGLMHGVYVLTTMGIVPQDKTKDVNILKLYYFIEGIMMDGSASYYKMLDKHREFMTDMINPNLDTELTEQEFTRTLAPHSKYPVVSLTKLEDEQDCYDCVPGTVTLKPEYYGGDFTPLFSDKKYCFDEGDLVSIISERDGLKTATHEDSDDVAASSYLKSCSSQEKLGPTYKIGHWLITEPDSKNPLSPFQNMIFSSYGLNHKVTSIPILKMILHYLRDFENGVKTSCLMCPHEKKAATDICCACEYAEASFEMILERINYDVYKM